MKISKRHLIWSSNGVEQCGNFWPFLIISDLFPIFDISTIFQFLLFLWNTRLDSSGKRLTRNRVINADSIQEFRDILSELDWGNMYSTTNPNDAYEYFFKGYSGIYNLKNILVKRKALQNPWMTKGLLKFSKLKESYTKYFRKKVHQMKTFVKHINISLKG